MYPREWPVAFMLNGSLSGVEEKWPVALRLGVDGVYARKWGVGLRLNGGYGRRVEMACWVEVKWWMKEMGWLMMYKEIGFWDVEYRKSIKEICEVDC